MTETCPHTDSEFADQSAHPPQWRRVAVTGIRYGAGMLCLAAVAVFLLLAVGPQTGKYRVLTVLSNSMQPHFAQGDMIVVIPRPLEEVRTGQVIVYHAPVEGRPLVTHRVIEVVERGPNPIVRTKGDANNARDAWQAKLRGTQLWEQRLAVPMAGHVIRAMRHPIAGKLALWGGLGVFVLLGLTQIWRPAPDLPSSDALFDDALFDDALFDDALFDDALPAYDWYDDAWHHDGRYLDELQWQAAS